MNGGHLGHKLLQTQEVPFTLEIEVRHSYENMYQTLHAL
jgi:hypothetical protein